MRRQLTSLCVLAAAGSAIPVAAGAQGFSVYEHGTCQMGRGGTGVARPCDDGSAMMFNPAGLAGMSGAVATAGVTVIDARGSFTDDLTGTKWDLMNDPIPVPHAYVALGSGDMAFGLGVFVPYGLGTKWDSLSFEGRFNGYDNNLQSIYVQPTVAYQLVPKIRFGAGFDLVIGAIEIEQRLDLSDAEISPGVTAGALGIPFHTEFARAELKASGATGFGGHLGAIVDVTDRLSFGARFLTPVKIDYDGTVDFAPVPTGLTLPPGNPLGAPGGTPLDAALATLNLFGENRPLADQTATASITMPMQLVAGVAFDVTSSLTLMADYQLSGWSVVDTIIGEFAQPDSITPDLVLVDNYKDTHAFRGGFEYQASDALTVRGGYLWHTEAAPPESVTPLLPEARRNEVTIGFGYRIAPSFWVNAAYQYIRQDKRRGRVRDYPSGMTSQEVANTINSGLYDFFAHLAGITLTVKF